MRSRLLFHMLVALAAAIPASGQELGLFVSADSVTVGERFLLSVTARHAYAAPARFPPADTAGASVFGDIEVMSLQARESFTRAGEHVDSIVYEVTTFALDTARIDPIPVLFTAGEDTFTVETDAAWLPVISLVPDDAEDVRDLAPLVDFPAPGWPYAAAAAALLLLAILIFLIVRRRRRASSVGADPEPPLPPEHEALGRLDQLGQIDLTIRTNVQPFYDELSGILRTYTARRLHVRAFESTSRELIRELQRRGVPGDETTRRLSVVLAASDLVKFADAVPPPNDGARMIQISRSIVHDVEEELRPPEEPDSNDDQPVQ